MSTHAFQQLGLRFCRWIAHTATAYHLWCAEQELRLADTSDMPDSLREARARNLDLLQGYRQRGEFPQQQENPYAALPCFIDSAGRLCAVACLMHASGDQATALEVAQTTNFARIRAMKFAKLDAWASKSGFTKQELARI